MYLGGRLTMSDSPFMLSASLRIVGGYKDVVCIKCSNNLTSKTFDNYEVILTDCGTSLAPVSPLSVADKLI